MHCDGGCEAYTRVAAGRVAHADLVWTLLLSITQHEHGICGTIGEIGVHHGAYFVLLAAAARAGERSFVCDIFEAGHQSGFNIDHGKLPTASAQLTSG